MPIIYHEGNIFENRIGLTVISEQANCAGSMGAGIALEIKRRFPEVDRAQKQWLHAGKQILGAVQMVRTHTGLTIARLYAQQHWRRVPGKINTDYRALKACLQKLNADLKPDEILGMPKIGAGYGGGDWNEISGIIEDAFPERTVHVYVLASPSAKRR